ncbi:MAG TPA: NrsF family protein, partial [Candidatus Solibacter sp.]
NSVAAGFAKGTLAGLAGVTMLELHCTNFEAPHVMVWHIAVLPVSAAIGTLAAWMARTYRR